MSGQILKVNQEQEDMIAIVMESLKARGIEAYRTSESDSSGTSAYDEIRYRLNDEVYHISFNSDWRTSYDEFTMLWNGNKPETPLDRFNRFKKSVMRKRGKKDVD